MAAKNGKASTGKKASQAKKPGSGQTAAKKAKRVLTDVLAGAAEGAVRGAAEAVVANTAKDEKAERKPKKSEK